MSAASENRLKGGEIEVAIDLFTRDVIWIERADDTPHSPGIERDPVSHIGDDIGRRLIVGAERVGETGDSWQQTRKMYEEVRYCAVLGVQDQCAVVTSTLSTRVPSMSTTSNDVWPATTRSAGRGIR